jgi:hypothetical protein
MVGSRSWEDASGYTHSAVVTGGFTDRPYLCLRNKQKKQKTGDEIKGKMTRVGKIKKISNPASTK